MNLEGESCVNEAAFATALIWKPGATDAHQFSNANVVGVDEIAGRGRRHTSRIAIDDGDDAEIAIVGVHREGDFLVGSHLVDVKHVLAGVAVRTGKARDGAAQGRASNKREGINRSRFREDGSNKTVEGRLREGARSVDGCSRGAVVRRNVRWTCTIKPVTETTQGVGRGAAIFHCTILRASNGGLDVALHLADGFRLRFSNLSWTNRLNSVLKLGHHVVLLEQLDVIAETGAAREFVHEGGNVLTLAHTSRNWSSKRVNSPLIVGGGGFALFGKRGNWRLLGSEDRQNVREVLTVRNGRAGIGGRIGI